MSIQTSDGYNIISVPTLNYIVNLKNILLFLLNLSLNTLFSDECVNQKTNSVKKEIRLITVFTIEI